MEKVAKQKWFSYMFSLLIAPFLMTSWKDKGVGIKPLPVMVGECKRQNNRQMQHQPLPSSSVHQKTACQDPLQEKSPPVSTEREASRIWSQHRLYFSWLLGCYFFRSVISCCQWRAVFVCVLTKVNLHLQLNKIQLVWVKMATTAEHL